ncbi:hypothetical protein RHMOL_Rhmol01G0110300 [Rhododendron molle]|uniref:Uncharacterized protein n=1 Tax=Rhododendron molle TaxID=49168 RepID=A0ACC0Q2V2_RHOML|nr:hypothetical protein RHMOL_Rhmol01G0110300 [Rhododendron molle]
MRHMLNGRPFGCAALGGKLNPLPYNGQRKERKRLQTPSLSKPPLSELRSATVHLLASICSSLAHQVIVISSNSKSSGDGSEELFIREYLDRRRSRRQASSISSNMLGSSDSNAERDHEYDGGFDTEPEITFTPTTNIAEPKLGPEAESRFNSQAEATTSRSAPSEAPSEDREIADLFERGQVCPHAHYFSGQVASNRIRAKREHRPEHITVPLMAICEAGLRFPLHPFLRELLAKFGLVPHYFAINSFRIVMAVIKLKELHNLEFTVADLFHTYIMSRHGKTERRYLSTHSNKEPLIDGLPDTDKWANFYIEVSGNYEFGDQTVRLQTVPKIKDFRDHRAITKRQQYLSVEKNVETLKAQICRDAPTLLGYDPSYKEKLKRKEKDAGPSTKDGAKRKAAVGKIVKENNPRPSNRTREPRVKFPTFKKSADFWFQESQPSNFSGIDVPPLRTLIP